MRYLTMKKLTNNDLLLCRIQAELFANCGLFCNYSSLVFVRRFMYSNLAKRFDDTTILLEVSTFKSMIEEIDEEYRKTTFGKYKNEDKEKMYWLGYVYRYWAIAYELPSNVLYQEVNPKLILDRYYLYHSMDINYVIERIVEEEKIFIRPNKTLLEIIEEYCKEF